MKRGLWGLFFDSLFQLGYNKYMLATGGFNPLFRQAFFYLSEMEFIMNKKLLLLPITVLLLLTGALVQALPLLPLPPLLLGLGSIKANSSTKSAIAATLANVNWAVAVFLIFLLVASILFVFLGIRRLKKLVVRKKYSGIVKLLYRLKSDLILLEGLAVGLVEEQRKAIESSKKEALSLLQSVLKEQCFLKRLGQHAYDRMLQTFSLVENEKLALSSQVALVDRWLKTFDLLSR